MKRALTPWRLCYVPLCLGVNLGLAAAWTPPLLSLSRNFLFSKHTPARANNRPTHRNDGQDSVLRRFFTVVNRGGVRALSGSSSSSVGIFVPLSRHLREHTGTDKSLLSMKCQRMCLGGFSSGVFLGYLTVLSMSNTWIRPEAEVSLIRFCLIAVVA